MPKRRISRASKRRLTFFGTISIFLIIYFLVCVAYNVYTIYSLYSTKKDLQNMYIQLQEETESLKIDIEKLNDEKYLANYAREHYSYSKDGEYIIKIEDIESMEKDISNEINKNYILIVLSLFMLFIFIYIIVKGKKKK